MDEIRRLDATLFLRRLAKPWRVVCFVLWTVFFVRILLDDYALTGGFDPTLLVVLVSVPAVLAFSAWKESVALRFQNPRMRALWHGIEERHGRFRQALKTLRKRQVADLRELPRTVEDVSRQMHLALRRADLVATEVAQSEGWLLGRPPISGRPSSDRQAQELYQIADRNIAEYRSHFQAVMATVERTEAQAAVLSTTLDTLRMKMLGYRFAGREVEAQAHDFMATIAEAKMQLDAIDKTLEELEMSPFPQAVSAMPPSPPPIPESETRREGRA